MSFHTEGDVPSTGSFDPNPSHPDHRGHHSLLHQKSTLKDLTSSWVLLVLRIYHGWLFLLSLVVIAGYSCNDLLNLFVHLTQNKDAWVITNFMTLYMKSLLVAFFITGLLQHGVWLLRDSIMLDMFRSYRRTLCCEGSGKDFPKVTWTISLEDITHQMILRASLTDSLQVSKDIPLDEMGRPSDNIEAGIQGARLPARSQLLGVRNPSDIERLDLPARLDFRLPEHHRSANFNGLERKDRIRAWMDMILQFIIVASIDIWPMIAAVAELSVLGVISLEWVNMVVTTAIKHCVYHILIYYFWSTVMDYYWKVVTFWKPAQQRLVQNHDQQDLSANVRRALLDHVVQEDFGYVAGDNADGDSADNDDALNVFVRVRELLLRQNVQWVMMGLGVFLLVLCLLLLPHHQQNLVIISGASGLTLIVTFIRFSWCGGHQTARQLAWKRVGRYSTAEEPEEGTSRANRIFWFQVNCGFDRTDIVLRYFVVFLATVFLMLVGVSTLCYNVATDDANIRHLFIPNLVFLLATVLAAIWCIMVMMVCLCCSEFWKFLLVQNFCFAFLSILLSAMSKEGVIATTVCLLASQVGMSRHRGTRSHGIFLTFFTIYITIIAAIAFTTAADDLGHDFSPAKAEWCNSTVGGCKEYTFPLHGLAGDNDYSFCGLSWPTGIHGTRPGTVSRNCPDTRLTLADFGHFARLPYFLPRAAGNPDMTNVTLFLKKYLPGWETQKSHHFSIKGEHKATFIHIRWLNTSVVAIRGTSSAAEIFQDVNFWMPSAFLQIAQILGPSLFSIRGTLPLMTGNFSEYRSDQIRELKKYVNDLKLKKEDTVYVTGHSLGGGLAAMIGGMLQVPAVTFTAPGMGDTSKILDSPDVTSQNLRHMDVNIIPKGDVVPQVDRQSGMIVPLDCEASAEECHYLQRTMCKILAACGDGGGREHPRNYARSCQGCGVNWGKQSSVVPNSMCKTDA